MNALQLLEFLLYQQSNGNDLSKTTVYLSDNDGTLEEADAVEVDSDGDIVIYC